MTLILTVASQHYVAQVSDRLVTDVQTKRPFDRISNKTLVYITPDAQVAIGYSGMAYLDGIPTDQWIAQLLTGLTFAPPGEPPRTHLGPREQILDIGLSCEYLRRELGRWVGRNKHLRILAPQVVVGGWQFTRRLWRPMIWVLEYSDSDRQYNVERTSADFWWFRNQFVLSQVPEVSELSRSDFTALKIKLRTCHEELAAEQALADTIRSVAMRGSTVGPHCVSILLLPPWKDRVRVRYLPYEAALRSEDQQKDETLRTARTQSLLQGGTPVYFSPWLIFPTRVVPPSLRVAMGAVFSYGSLNVQLETPELQSPGLPGSGMPTYDFGLVTPDMDNISLSLSYSDEPDKKTEIGHSKPQCRPSDPTRRQHR